MVEQQPNLIGLILAVGFLLLFLLYRRWGNKVIRYRRAIIKQRFDDLEAGLEKNLSEYSCYTNNHPYVWGETNYVEEKLSMIDACKWQHSGQFGAPGGDLDFSLKVDESRRAIYIAHHSVNFDWTSLYHYDDWLESMRGVGENIEKYKHEERERRKPKNQIIV